MAFAQALDEKSMELFNEVGKRPFSQQAVFFLNAFWTEFGDQAEYIYAVSWHIMKMADMNGKGTMYVHLYEEGDDLDFDLGLYFFEQLCKINERPEDFKTTHADWHKANPNWATDFKSSMPVMQTSIVRKKELRDKVDINFDGRVSFIEFLLYQYKANPKDLMDRSMGEEDEDELIRKAREALEAVNRRIAAYEAEKFRLEEGSKQSGVKGLRMKNELAQLASGPLWEELNKALITAEAAVRIATRRAKAEGKKVGSGGSGGSKQAGRSDGAIWWMNRDLAEKQAKYGRRK
jgi:hypothetical protein